MIFGEFCVVVLGLFLVSLDLLFCAFLVEFLLLFVHVSEFLYLFVDVFRGDGVDHGLLCAQIGFGRDFVLQLGLPPLSCNRRGSRMVNWLVGWLVR